MSDWEQPVRYDADKVTGWVPLEEITHALDEIWSLRRQAAIEVLAIDAVLAYKGIPLKARALLQGMRQQLVEMAHGRAIALLPLMSYLAGKQALLDVGAKEGLTRDSWLKEWQ